MAKYVPHAQETSNAAHRKRVTELLQYFKKSHGCDAAFIARAPGRVNLIGEHVDYSGFDVLPMAIERDVMVAAVAKSIPSGILSTITVCNTDSNYGDGTYTLDELEAAGDGRHLFTTDSTRWHRYLLAATAGMRAIHQHHAEEDKTQEGDGGETKEGRRFLLCVDGQVPPGSGLSSSSALVCALLLALLQCCAEGKHSDIENANANVEGTRTALPSAEQAATAAAECERTIGLESGGMDQAISFMAQRGVAKRIAFQPILHARDVHLPSRAVFVLCDALVAHELAKSSSADGYNVRVAECRLAANLLRHIERGKGVECEGNTKNGFMATLREVKEAHNWDLETAEARARDLMEKYKSGITSSEAGEVLEWTADEVSKRITQRIGSTLADGTERRLMVGQRALHVYQEARRVEKFYDACRGGDDSTPSEELIGCLGQLMDSSHASCASLYNCSCPELDRTVAACKEHGAVGARLTGAGWGGWVIALLDGGDSLSPQSPSSPTTQEQRISSFVSGMQESMGYEDTSRHLLVSVACDGAAVLRL